MKFIYVLFFTVLFTIAAYAQKEKPRVAVLQLKSDGISDAESQTMTDRLRGELVKTKAFTIIERGEMDEILNEQGFQMTGCTSSECAVEAGKLLSANQICAGSIGKVGSLFTVSVRLIDVENGQIIKNVIEDCKCPIEQVLTKSLHKVALKLAGIRNDKSLKNEGSGFISIISSPVGANIYVNGKIIGKTPKVLNLPANENIDIKLTSHSYENWLMNIRLKEGETKEINAKMIRQKGKITFSKIPSDSYLIFNKKTYKINKSGITLPVGNYKFRIYSPGYKDKNISLSINAGITKNINVMLEKKTTGGAFVRSFFVPGWGQGYQQKTARAWIYSLGFFGSLSGSYAYSKMYNDLAADYDKIRAEYKQEFDPEEIERLAGEMQNAYDDVISAENMRNIFYGLTAGIWLWNVIDAAFLPPAWHNKTRFSAVPMMDGVVLGAALQW